MKKSHQNIINKAAVIIVFCAIFALTGASGVLAQTDPRDPPVLDDTFTGGAGATTVKTVTSFQGLLQRIIGWVQVFFYIIATLMIILAAYDYLSSGGDETKVKTAKQRVIYAIVAIAIAVVAGGVVRLVQTFVG